MGQKKVQWSAVWRLAARQHGVVARWQLLALGMNSDEIQYRLETRRLHRVWRGVYAVGRPELSERGSPGSSSIGGGRSLSPESTEFQ
jgi:hypothetical protein